MPPPNTGWEQEQNSWVSTQCQLVSRSINSVSQWSSWLSLPSDKGHIVKWLFKKMAFWRIRAHNKRSEAEKVLDLSHWQYIFLFTCHSSQLWIGRSMDICMECSAVFTLLCTFMVQITLPCINLRQKKRCPPVQRPGRSEMLKLFRIRSLEVYNNDVTEKQLGFKAHPACTLDIEQKNFIRKHSLLSTLT